MSSRIENDDVGLTAKTRKALFKTLQTRAGPGKAISFMHLTMLWPRVESWNGNIFDFHETFSSPGGKKY